MFFTILLLSILFICLNIYIVYHSYTRYSPPKDMKKNLIKTNGIITKNFRHTGIHLFRHTMLSDLISSNLIRIEYIVNDISYHKLVYLYGNFPFLIPGNEISLCYDAEHPEHSYLDINLKDLIKTDSFSIGISILFIIIMVVIIMFFTKA